MKQHNYEYKNQKSEAPQNDWVSANPDEVLDQSKPWSNVNVLHVSNVLEILDK